MTPPASPSSDPLLAIAVFGESASVALRRGGAQPRLVIAAEPAGRSHSSSLLPLVSDVMARSSCGLAELAGVAFEAGPGGFTSLRVACALAQGLGIALGVPVCPVGSLEAAAVSLVLGQRVGADAVTQARVLVANDARMGECYFGVFEVAVDPARQSARVSTLLEAQCGDPQRVVDAFGCWSRQCPGLRIAGDAHHRHAGLGSALGGLGVTPADARPDARAVAMIAAGPEMAWLDAADAAPRYVREKVALDVDEQRALRAAAAT